MFDRIKAARKRLDIPAGTAVRFEPGDTKTVILCSIGGNKVVKGGNGLTDFVASKLAEGISEDIFRGFGHLPEPDVLPWFTHRDISREEYISMYGPTVGDRVRLGDTSLWIQIERDSVGLIIVLTHSTVSSLRRPYMATKSNLVVVSHGADSLTKLLHFKPRQDNSRWYGPSVWTELRRGTRPRHHKCRDR